VHAIDNKSGKLSKRVPCQFDLLNINYVNLLQLLTNYKSSAQRDGQPIYVCLTAVSPIMFLQIGVQLTLTIKQYRISKQQTLLTGNYSGLYTNLFTGRSSILCFLNDILENKKYIMKRCPCELSAKPLNKCVITQLTTPGQ
jgi:hypothetical protein